MFRKFGAFALTKINLPAKVSDAIVQGLRIKKMLTLMVEMSKRAAFTLLHLLMTHPTTFVPSLFGNIPDFRRSHLRLYPLTEILFLSLCALTAGAVIVSRVV